MPATAGSPPAAGQQQCLVDDNQRLPGPVGQPQQFAQVQAGQAVQRLKIDQGASLGQRLVDAQFLERQLGGPVMPGRVAGIELQRLAAVAASRPPRQRA